MPPKKSAAPPEAAQQGSFFAEELVHSGVTDPAIQTTSVRLELVADGTYPEPAVTSFEAPAIPEVSKALHQAVVTDNRRKGQLGKHSPLERTGRYRDVEPGDVLPGFGIVRRSNLKAAKSHAESLDRESGRS